MTENRLIRALERAVLAFADAPFAVVGGLAVSARTEPRFTRDVDFAVAVASDSEAEDIVGRLRAHGFRPVALLEQDAAARLASARLAAPGETEAGIVVDLLFASSGVEPELVRDAEPVELFPGVVARVATRSYLIALKVLARDDETRPQDAADLRALVRVSSSHEIAQARRIVELIAERGFHRGRDLIAALEAVAGR